MVKVEDFSCPLWKSPVLPVRISFSKFISLVIFENISRLSYHFPIGLKILSTALAPPICGTDVSPQIINKAIKEFLPILIEKISELNFRARDISLHTLLSLFRHPALEVGNLVVACMDICDFGDDIRPKNPIPVEKQQWRLVLARLEIILHVCQEYGYNPNAWNWQPVFQYLVTPSLFHSNLDVRLLAVELTVILYQYLGKRFFNENLLVNK